MQAVLRHQANAEGDDFPQGIDAKAHRSDPLRAEVINTAVVRGASIETVTTPWGGFHRHAPEPA